MQSKAVFPACLRQRAFAGCSHGKCGQASFPLPSLDNGRHDWFSRSTFALTTHSHRHVFLLEVQKAGLRVSIGVLFCGEAGDLAEYPFMLLHLQRWTGFDGLTCGRRHPDCPASTRPSASPLFQLLVAGLFTIQKFRITLRPRPRSAYRLPQRSFDVRRFHNLQEIITTGSQQHEFWVSQCFFNELHT